MTKKVELLAPAGSWNAFVAAINNGADAIYIGGKNFSARAFADNFDHDELKKAVRYAHLFNRKVYVTLNTLITDFEFENVKKEIEFLYSINVDALIIQDLGVYYYIKDKYPDFEIHASTQMHVHNINGVKNCQKLGFKRVVVARESNLDFIKEACKEDIEIEAFVHGALCVCYSGQCLMSSVTKNRSANKGMCAQCCRLKYTLINKNDNLPLETDSDYLLSPKDMMLINDINDLIDAGVSSFKIEGRMKSSAYVGYVTRLYRKAINAYYNKEKYSISEQELTNLKYLFNRNFTNSYLLNNNTDIFGQKRPNHLGEKIGIVKKVNKESILIQLDADLNQYDGIRIVSGNNEYGQIVNFLSVNGNYTSKALKGEICEIKSKDNIKYNDIVYKTIDHKLEESINNTESIKVDIDLLVCAKLDQNIKIIASNETFKFEYDSNVVALKAKTAPIDKDNFLKHFTLNKSVYSIKDLKYEADNIFIPVKNINELKHSFIDALDEYRLNQFNRKEIKSTISLNNNFKENNEILDNLNSLTISNSVVNINNIYVKENINLITEIGGLLLDFDNKVASYTLNVANSYAYEFLIRLGYKSIILSSELNKAEIDELVNVYKKRNLLDIKPILLKDTKRTLMYLKANPFNKYTDNFENYLLDDGINKYELFDNNGISEIRELKGYNFGLNSKGLKSISILTKDAINTKK